MNGKCNVKEGSARGQDRVSMENIGNTILVMSGKGGVGKSTVSANLAASLAARGYRVGLLDVDIHGPNIPKIMGLEGRQLDAGPELIAPVEHPSGVRVVSMGFLLPDPDSPVIWRGPLKMGAIKQFLSEVSWGDLDFLIIDHPPGTGDEPLSVAQLIPERSLAIIVTTPQDVALLDSRKAVTFSRRLELRLLGIVENMSGFSCPHCGGEIDLFKKGGGERAAEEMGVPFLGRIPFDLDVVNDCDGGRIRVSEGEGPVREAFDSIIEKLLTLAEVERKQSAESGGPT